MEGRSGRGADRARSAAGQQAPEDRACGAARAEHCGRYGAGAVHRVAAACADGGAAEGDRVFLWRGGIFLRDRPADRLLHGEGAAQGAVHGLLLRADVHSAGAELSAWTLNQETRAAAK